MLNGQYCTIWNEAICFFTQPYAYADWNLDLGKTYEISRVMFIGPSRAVRIEGSSLHIGNSSDVGSNQQVLLVDTWLGKGEEYHVAVSPAITGRYVGFKGFSKLAICKIEIYE